MIFQASNDPLDVTLLLFPGLSIMSLAATLDPMRGANRVLGRTLYRWKLASMDGEASLASCGLSVPVDTCFDPNAAQDMLIVIASFNAADPAAKKVLWALDRGARNSKAVGGIEAGPWLLGYAGLLNGRQATTHWEDLEEFAARFPYVDVRPDRWVIDGPVFTTGGAAPALDLMLALIRARQGYSVALDVASLYVYEGARASSDMQPIVSLGHIRQHEPRIAEAIRIMEAHIDNPLTVAAIAAQLGLSARSLETLFRRTIAKSPGAYYVGLRLRTARRLIVDTNISVANVAVRTGFSSSAALSRAFRREFAHTPSALRRKAR